VPNTPTSFWIMAVAAATYAAAVAYSRISRRFPRSTTRPAASVTSVASS